MVLPQFEPSGNVFISSSDFQDWNSQFCENDSHGINGIVLSEIPKERDQEPSHCFA